MNINKLIKIVGIVCLAFVALVVFVYKNTQAEIKKIAIHTEKIYGDIEFSGRVDSIIKIRRGGRTYGLMCIDLDYSNLDSFYNFDKYTALKIKDNKAVLPIGFVGEHPILRSDFLFKTNYIDVNKKENTKIIFYSNNDSLVEKWSFRNNNLREEDLLKCGY